MTTPIFYGQVSKGKLVLNQPQKYLVHLSGLEGKQIELVLRKRRSKRSLNQNAYYWGVVVEIIANHCGYEPDELHEALKYKFLSSHEPDEQGLVKIGSTAKLTTVEFIQYTNKVVRWAAESLNIYIPDPNQVEYVN